MPTRCDRIACDACRDRTAARPLSLRIRIADLEDPLNRAGIPSVAEQDVARTAGFREAPGRLESAGEVAP